MIYALLLLNKCFIIAKKNILKNIKINLGCYDSKYNLNLS